MQSERDRRLIRIVEDALKEQPESRYSFLLRASEGDEALMADAAELLAQTGPNTHFLTSWAAGKAARLIEAVPLLSPGDRLGPYRVERKLASGGMGEVYEATDLRLKRRVAVKVLTTTQTDAEVRTRTLEEARTLSRLNHPSICTIHDVGIHEDVPFLVMEFLEGETLRDALRRQTPPATTAIDWAINIADALHAAHLRGVVHRDLKPENIVITRNGAKLLDFGIAALTTQLDDLRPAGTLPYMSPEQILRERIDPRSDLFAFGAILYEMLSGRPAFEGEVPETIAKSILSDKPGDIARDLNSLPHGLQDLIEACLKRSPDERWQSAFDAAATLRWIRQGAFQPRAQTSARTKVSIGAGAAACLALAALIWWSRPSQAEPQPVTFTIQAESGTELAKPAELAVAPDGKSLAFSAVDRQTMRIYIRRLDEVHARLIAGSENGGHPFWSADGTALGFFGDSKLKRISLGGGPAVIVCDAPHGVSGTWGSSGDIVFANSTGPLYHVNASGGIPRAVTRLNSKEEETDHRWPVFLPDGSHFLYTAHSNRHEGKLFVGDTTGSSASYVLDTPGTSAFSKGLLYFLRGSTLIAQQFDPSTFRVRGDTVPVAETVASSSFSAQSGVVAFWSGASISPASLLWVDRTGKVIGDAGPPALYGGVVNSPAGDAIAATVCESVDCANPAMSNMVRRYNLRILRSGSPPVQFTNDEAVAAMPVWSPDGSELIYGSTKGGHMDLYRRKIRGGSETLLLAGAVDRGATSWSRDGRYLAYTELRPESKFDIWVLDLKTGKSSVFLKTKFNETLAAFSPNGKWVAYASDDRGAWGVSVLPFPSDPDTRGKPRPVRVSPSNGFLPIWRSDGSELYYQAGMDVMAASIEEKAGSINIGPPRRLFSLRRLTSIGNSFAPSPDGARFLILNGDVKADLPITVSIR